jgi:hypothetical protein
MRIDVIAADTNLWHVQVVDLTTGETISKTKVDDKSMIKPVVQAYMRKYRKATICPTDKRQYNLY